MPAIQAEYITVCLQTAKGASDEEVRGLEYLLRGCVTHNVNTVYAACSDERPRVQAAAMAILRQHLNKTSGLRA